MEFLKPAFSLAFLQSQIHVLLCPKVRGNFTMRYSLETSTRFWCQFWMACVYLCSRLSFQYCFCSAVWNWDWLDWQLLFFFFKFILFVFLFCLPERNHKPNCLKERSVPWFHVKNGDLFCCRWFKNPFSYSGDSEYHCTVVLQPSLEYSFRNYLDTEWNYENVNWPQFCKQCNR